MKNNYRIIHILSILVVWSAIFLSCRQESKPVVDISNTQDFVQIPLSYAEGFELYHRGDHQTKIVLHDLNNHKNILATYIISDSDIKGVVDGTTYFKRPLSALSMSSSTHAAFLVALGLGEHIKGMTYTDYVQDPFLKTKIKNGSIIDITGAECVDMEKLVATSSDAYVISPFAMNAMGKFKSIGMPVIIVSEYLEEHPLARAEWIKLFGVLYGEEEKANRIFTEIEKKYLSLTALVTNPEKPPKVLIGSEQNGVWHMPGADSFIAHVIQDAGGEYLFSDLKGNQNQQVDIEILMSRANKVDYWGKILSNDLSLSDLGTENEKLQALKAVQSGNVFFCNTTTSDYFGKAILEPEVILSDLIYILHPSVVKDHESKYFQLAR